MRFHQALILAGLIAGGLAGSAAAEEHGSLGNVEKGRALAENYCDSCHLVEPPGRRMPLFKRGPAFPEIATRPETSNESLHRFLAKPHPEGKASYPDLSPAQLNDVIGYILSFRGKPG